MLGAFSRVKRAKQIGKDPFLTQKSSGFGAQG